MDNLACAAGVPFSFMSMLDREIELKGRLRSWGRPIRTSSDFHGGNDSSIEQATLAMTIKHT
jgi:hypothetical protein